MLARNQNNDSAARSPRVCGSRMYSILKYGHVAIHTRSRLAVCTTLNTKVSAWCSTENYLQLQPPSQSVPNRLLAKAIDKIPDFQFIIYKSLWKRRRGTTILPRILSWHMFAATYLGMNVNAFKQNTPPNP